MIDMKGVVALGMCGLGAIGGAVLTVPMLLTGFFFPVVLSFAWAPVFVGAVGGLIVGAIMEMRK